MLPLPFDIGGCRGSSSDKLKSIPPTGSMLIPILGCKTKQFSQTQRAINETMDEVIRLYCPSGGLREQKEKPLHPAV
jgi:hypothetical protein